MRASKSNRRRVGLPGGKRKRLWTHMREAKSLGVRKVEAPERGGPFMRKARTARLTARCEAVDLVPPAEVGGETMHMVAVSARDERPPKTVEARKKALHWLLPATECARSLRRDGGDGSALVRAHTNTGSSATSTRLPPVGIVVSSTNCSPWSCRPGYLPAWLPRVR